MLWGHDLRSRVAIYGPARMLNASCMLQVLRVGEALLASQQAQLLPELLRLAGEASDSPGVQPLQVVLREKKDPTNKSQHPYTGTACHTAALHHAGHGNPACSWSRACKCCPDQWHSQDWIMCLLLGTGLMLGHSLAL